jgi:single-strand DNA-binding protein
LRDLTTTLREEAMNTVLLVGNLGDVPKVGESKGVTWARFSMATTERFKSKNGKPAERTDWHQVYAFGSLATTLEGLAKGAKVAVRGALRKNSFEGEDGETRHVVEVQATEVEFLRRGREREEA